VEGADINPPYRVVTEHVQDDSFAVSKNSQVHVMGDAKSGRWHLNLNPVRLSFINLSHGISPPAC